MEKVIDLKQFHQGLVDTLIEMEKEHEFPNHFYQAFLAGENTIYQKEISESKTFDEEWISTVESYFPSLDKIVRDAKSGLRYEQDVMAIEKAKKTNSDSVRHLAANTHLIKEIRPDMVIPKKILVTQAEIEFGIYENRFIKTLIERLFDFVNRRFNTVKTNIDSYTTKHFNLNSNFEVRSTKVAMEIDLKLVEDLQDEGVKQQNYELLGRIQFLLKKINGLKMSSFMQDIKHAKPVIPPIMQTSIILKNVNYRHAYLLWLFLDKYNNLAFDIETEERNLTFDRYYLKNVYQTALVAFTNVYGNQEELSDHYQYLDKKNYKRKSPKFTKKHLKSIASDLDPFVLEDNQINQYFLDQNKKIFKKSLEAHAEESSSYEVALKKALRDTIAISNALYESYFELPDDDYDIFSRMVKKDLDETLQETREKAKIARIIRETKEVDYNNAVRLERKILKDIERLDKERTIEVQKKIKHQAKRKSLEERLQLEKENAAQVQSTLSEYMAFVSEQRRLIADEHTEVSVKLREERKRLAEEEKKQIAEAKQKAKQKYDLELKRIKDKQKQQKLKLTEQAKLKKQAERERLKAATQKLRAQSAEAVKKQKAVIQSKSNEKIAKLKEEA